MKEYSMEKVINTILSHKTLHKMSLFATSKAGKDVRVLDHPGDTCFSSQDYWTGLNIQLGKTFYQKTFNDNNPISITDIKSKYFSIASVLFGAYYHELFHVLFTPFQYCETLTYNCNPAFRMFAHTVSNILEDITIEGTGCNRYPFAQQYIDAIATCFRQPSQLEMLKDAITNEPNNPGTLTAYLLHFCRETDLSSLPEYKLWNDNKEFIEWGAYKCINTIDPKLRIRRQMAFALELCKILDMKEPSKDNMESPDLSNLKEQSQGLGGSDGGASGKGAQSIQPLNSFSNTATQGPRNNDPQETDEDIKVSEGELQQQKAQRSEVNGESTESSPLNADLTKEGITMLANDDPVSRYSHFADRLDKYLKTSQYLPEYNKIVSENETTIRNCVAIIRKMYAVNNSSWSHYKMNGKLDSSTFYKKGNYKIFKKKNAPSPTADLVFEILVDNSGSMHGSKARLAGKALIIFCESLNRLHIPFSVDAFTQGGAAITINLKDYDELYDKTKTNMTLFTQQFDVNKLNTWSGNIDEINLRYVSEELSLRKEKDKVLVVISDGATCGDWNTLKHVADSIENSGTTVLGIGVFDNNVEKIYKNHTVLKTQDDLENLGGFLNKYLIGKIFK